MNAWVNANKVESKDPSSNFLSPALDRAVSCCLFLLNHRGNETLRSRSVASGRCTLIFAIFYIFVTLPPVYQQQFHFHPEESLASHALSENDYKQNIASGYVYFEILAPEELQYTYKISPAPFALPFNSTFRDPIALVMSEPTCGCGFLQNYEDIEVMDSFLANDLQTLTPNFLAKMFWKIGAREKNQPSSHTLIKIP